MTSLSSCGSIYVKCIFVYAVIKIFFYICYNITSSVLYVNDSVCSMYFLSKTMNKGFSSVVILIFLALVVLFALGIYMIVTRFDIGDGLSLPQINIPRGIDSDASPSATNTPPSSTRSPEQNVSDQKMAQAIQLRDEGAYDEGERLIREVFDEAVEKGDRTLAVESGNNASIQYRLSAGRAQRQGDTQLAQEYTEKSLAIYDTLREKEWLDENDPANARSWAHALLYAGRIDQSLPALNASRKLQESSAAQGDELCHIGAALFAKGSYDDAISRVNEGLQLIQDNDGSPVWETFCLMTQASIYSHQGQAAEAQSSLNQAYIRAQDNNLTVRTEEIEYMMNQPSGSINVLRAVGTGPAR